MSNRSQLTNDLYESAKLLIGKNTKILVKYMVNLETKNDKLEKKMLVLTPLRVYIFTAKVPSRVDSHFHYLDIQSIESKDPSHVSISTGEKTLVFSSIGDAENFSSNVDVILTDLSSAIKQIFPTVPLKYIIKKIAVEPIERNSIFSEELRSSLTRNIGPCGGFSVQYACMCDFHGIQYREEVAWDIDTIYLSHDNRILNLHDFDHLDQKDLMAIISALEYNTFFRGIKITNMRMSTETLEKLLHILKRSMWLEEIHLEALGLRSDFIHKMTYSVISNINPSLRSIDLSYNLFEDKGATSLAVAVAKLSKGLLKLNLSHCGLTSKGVNQLIQSLCLNHNISNSLTYLDLSGNNLKDDVTNLYNFLAQPNVIEHLDVSKTDTILENLFGALLRGCSTNLLNLNLSYNMFCTKKGKEIPPSFKQFFTSSLSLKYLNIANCKLPLEALKHLLLGLACNESTAGLYLDLSGNSFNAQGAHVLESCIHGVRVLSSLDIGDNNFDLELASVLPAIGRNPSIRVLRMTKCFIGLKLKHIFAIMNALVNLIQTEEFQLQELVLSENKLKHDIYNFINALGSNQHLQILDITGNLMGDIGARLLAKALQINNRLKIIYLDRNNISIQGYSDIVYGLEHNYSMRNIPFPLYDVAGCLKQYPDRTDLVMRKMQDILLRNGSGKRRGNEHGFRLQHGLLLSSTHQIVDKVVAETQEIMSHKQFSQDSGLAHLLEDAENCKQLLPKLQEIIRCDSHPIEIRLGRIREELISSIIQYLNDIMETMLRTSIEQCPLALNNQTVLTELRKSCNEKIKKSEDFLQNSLVNDSNGEIMSALSEAEHGLAVLISDRITDEVLEALMRYKNGFASHSHAKCILTNENLSRSRQGLDHLAHSIGLDLPKLGLNSPIKLEYLNLATPQHEIKRRSLARKVRPQSVVGLGVENLSLTNIPDTVEKQSLEANSSASSKHDSQVWQSTKIQCYGSITELPSQSLTLQHLVKSRPKRAKTHTSKKNVRTMDTSIIEFSEGIDTFFRYNSETPLTLTPLVSPTSEECSSLSFVGGSPGLNRDNDGCISHISSGEITHDLEKQRSVQLDKEFPVIKYSNWTQRSKSSDNLEKNTSSISKPAPLVKINAKRVKSSITSKAGHTKELKSSDCFISINTEQHDNANIIMNLKPRPWSVLGNESEKEFECNYMDKSEDSISDDGDVVLISGQTPGGSIIGITPGAIKCLCNNSINPKS